MLTSNMTANELATTEEWGAFCSGLKWLFSRQDERIGGWPSGSAPDTISPRCTAHVIAPLLDVYPVGKASVERGILYLSKHSIRTTSVYWKRQTVDGFQQHDIPATLVSTLALLRYHRLTGIQIEPSPDYLRRSGQKVIEEAIEHAPRYVEEVSCWLFLACASLLEEIGSDGGLWDRLLSSTGKYGIPEAHGVDRYSSAPNKRSEVLETVEVLHAFLKSGRCEIERITAGVDYVLEEAYDDIDGNTYWQAPKGSAHQGPLLSTRYIMLFLEEYRPHARSSDLIQRVDFARRRAAQWVARVQMADGSWLTSTKETLSPNFCGYALQALWKVIKLSCRPEEQHKLVDIAANEVGKIWPSGDEDTGQSIRMPTGALEVFIVHGHDDELKNEVARFIRQFGLKAVILHELPNRGRTIIEKFEDYSDVQFVVVLATPDDLGSKKADPVQLRPRPRQNVLFELGYFIGKIGRRNVVLLCKDDKDDKGNKVKMQIPTDYNGVVYVPVEEGSNSWKEELAKELKAAGLLSN